ncbi:MAG: hypothetical protein LBD79_01470 [Treponema sp.]|nr:hypothetical protein [Treponema sp.]
MSLLEGFTTLDRLVKFVSENFINDSEELITHSLEKAKHDVNTETPIHQFQSRIKIGKSSESFTIRAFLS